MQPLETKKNAELEKKFGGVLTTENLKNSTEGVEAQQNA